MSILVDLLIDKPGLACLLCIIPQCLRQREATDYPTYSTYLYMVIDYSYNYSNYLEHSDSRKQIFEQTNSEYILPTSIDFESFTTLGSQLCGGSLLV